MAGRRAARIVRVCSVAAAEDRPLLVPDEPVSGGGQADDVALPGGIKAVVVHAHVVGAVVHDLHRDGAYWVLMLQSLQVVHAPAWHEFNHERRGVMQAFDVGLAGSATIQHQRPGITEQ